MKYIKKFTLNEEESKFKDYFYKDLPVGQKPRSIGKQIKDMFMKNPKVVVESELMYSDRFREHLEKMDSRMAGIISDLESDDDNRFSITNIGFVDGDRISYVDSGDKETNAPRKNMDVVEFAKIALKNYRFTEKAYNVFLRKYQKAMTDDGERGAFD